MRLDNNLIRRPRQPPIRSLPGCFGLIPHSRVTKTHILLVQDHSRIEIFVFIDGSARVELTFDLCAEADGAADLFFFKKKEIKVSWVGGGEDFLGGRGTYRDYRVKLEGEKKRVFR